MPNGNNQDLSLINSFFRVLQPKQREARVPGTRSEGGRRRLEERFGPFRGSTLARSKLSSTFNNQSTLSSTFSGTRPNNSLSNLKESPNNLLSAAFAQASGGPSPLRDVLGDLTRGRATRESLIGNLVLTGGIASGFGIGGGRARKAISDLRNSPRATLMDALELAASQGKISSIFPTLSGARLDSFPGSGKTRRTLNIGGVNQSVFIDDEIQRLLNLLQHLGRL